MLITENFVRRENTPTCAFSEGIAEYESVRVLAKQENAVENFANKENLVLPSAMIFQYQIVLKFEV